MQTTEILGVPILSANVSSVIDTLNGWISAKESRYICAVDVHNVMLAQSDTRHKEALLAADMVTPDGTPLVWIAHLRGDRNMRRVCGPDLFAAVCAASGERGWTHFLVGGKPGVADELSQLMAKNYPGIRVVGTNCPPFRSLSDVEKLQLVHEINASKPDIVWVGLGCPKQERWMLEHRELLHSATMIGVGAAFDFHTGRLKRAPRWMRSSGLEWVHRFCSEPTRLWRRYVVLAPLFVVASLFETFESITIFPIKLWRRK